MANGTANINVNINGQQASLTYGDLLKKAAMLNRELKELTPGTDTFVRKSADLKKVRGELNNIQAGVNATKESMISMQTVMSVLGGISLAGIVQQIFQIGRRVIDTTATFQKFEAVLTNALGSRSAAREALDNLQEFAAKTPFQIDELTGSFVKLVNRGFKPTNEQLRQIGDLAASQGKSFDQLTEAILDAQTGENERLKEFGVRAKTVGDQVQLSFKGQTIEVKRTDEAIRDAILSFGNLEGVAGSMDAVSRTLGGQLSNLADNVTTLFKTMGEGFLGRAVSILVGGFNRLVGSVTETLKVTEDQTMAVRTEQAEMNVLFETLKTGNFTQNERNRLIGEINTKYGDYLPNLISEKDSIDDIAKAQAAANNLLEQKIIYIALEEEIAKVLKASAEAADGAYQAEKRRQENRQRLASDGTIDDVRQIEALQGQQALLEVIREEQLDLVKSTPEQVQQIESTYNELAKRLGTTIAQIRSAFGGTPEGPGAATVAAAKKAAQKKEQESEAEHLLRLNEVRDAASQAYLDMIDAENAAIIANLEAQIQADEAYQQRKRDIAEEARLAGMTDMEIEVEQIRMHYERLIQEAEFYGIETVALRQRMAEEINDIARRETEFQKRLNLEKVSGYADLSAALGDFLAGDEKARKQHAEAVKAFEIGSILANLYAEIQGYFRSGATLGPAGAVLAKIQSAAATVRAFAAVRRVASQKFAEGGFTGPGGERDSTGHRVAGVVHDHEWVAPKWMNESPATAPVIRALENIRQRGFAEGGFTTPNTTPNAATLAAAVNDEPIRKLEATLNELGRAVARMPQRLRAEVVYQDIEDAGKTLNDIRDLASL